MRRGTARNALGWPQSVRNVSADRFGRLNLISRVQPIAVKPAMA
jgi:hypothetical protein